MAEKETADHSQSTESGRRTRARFGESYGLVLLFIGFSIIITMLGTSLYWPKLLSVIVLGITLLLALRTSQARRRTIIFGRCGVLISVIIVLLQVFFQVEVLNWLPPAIDFALVILTPVAIARHTLSSRVISIQTILGALCTYLLIGLGFTYLYATCEKIFPPSIFQIGNASLALGNLLYFSFITITTVGYGDITPHGGLAQALAVTEAIIGQIYLVTIVALLIANLGKERTPTERGRKS